MKQQPLQSRTSSLLEASTNVLAGFALALVIQRLIYPLFGLATALTTDLMLAGIFALVSLIRSYVIRRLFERRTVASLRRIDHART